MHNMQQIKKMFQKIQVIRSPRHRLATFGTSRISYQLVTDVPGLVDRSRIRIGVVTAQKPSIITPHDIQNQFEGFGEDVHDYVNTLVNQYGKALRGLEYNFKNEMEATRIELSSPDAITQKLSKEFDNTEGYNNALIRGTDRIWELSIMKFIVEETIASFASNVKELQERGFFEGDERISQQRQREIENMFRAARSDLSLIPLLGKKLKEYGLFEQYQDSFFKLIGR